LKPAPVYALCVCLLCFFLISVQMNLFESEKQELPFIAGDKGKSAENKSNDELQDINNDSKLLSIPENVKKVTTRLINSENTDREKVIALLEFVSTFNINYDPSSQYREHGEFTATQVWNTKKAICTEFAYLVVAIAREAGLKADVALAFRHKDMTAAWSKLYRHMIAVIYISKAGSPSSKNIPFIIDFASNDSISNYLELLNFSSDITEHAFVKKLHLTRAFSEFNPLSDNQILSYHYLNSAYFYSKRNEWNKGLEAAKLAVEYDKKNHLAAYALALIYTQLNSYQKALPYIRQALSLEPGEIEYLKLELSILTNLNAPEQDIKKVKELIEKIQNNQTDLLIDDCENGDRINNWGGYWFTDADFLSGGRSTIYPKPKKLFSMTLEGYESDYAAKVWGNLIRTKRDDGYIVFGILLSPARMPAELSDFKGVQFMVKGDGKNWRVRLVCECDTGYDWYGYTFKTEKDKWILIKADFSKFQQEGWGKKISLDMTKILDISWEIDQSSRPIGSNFEFECAIDNVRLYYDPEKFDLLTSFLF
jgi:tetratricopeptide (TPR) repeat protein